MKSENVWCVSGIVYMPADRNTTGQIRRCVVTDCESGDNAIRMYEAFCSPYKTTILLCKKATVPMLVNYMKEKATVL